VLPKLEPRVRKRGFSKLLPEGLEDAARGMKYGALRLEAGDHPSEGIRLYVSAGYKRIEPFGIYVECQRSVCY
jgi:putative acetyltransferase